YFDKRHFKAELLPIGTLVYISKAPDYTGSSTKLQRRYRGPLVVIEVLSNDTYSVSELVPTESHHYVTTAHISQLTVWRPNSKHRDDCLIEDNNSDVESLAESNSLLEEAEFSVPQESEQMYNQPDVDSDVHYEQRNTRPQRTRRVPARFDDFVYK